MSDTVRVFISHATSDAGFAERLAADLRRAGVDVWLDATHLAGTGGDFVARISAALDSRDVLILILSPAALASKWVPDEMNVAIARHKEGAMRAPLIVVKDPVAPHIIPGLWIIYNRIDAAQLGYDQALPLIYSSLGLTPPLKPQDAQETVVAGAINILPPVMERTPPGSVAIPVARPQHAPAQRRRWGILLPIVLFVVLFLVAFGSLTLAPELLPPYRRPTSKGQVSHSPTPPGRVATTVTPGRATATPSPSLVHGSLLWSYPLGSSVDSNLTVANGVIYMGLDNGRILAFNVNTQTTLWSYPTQGLVESTPYVDTANGLVYAGSNDGNLYALTAATGKFDWSRKTKGYVASSPTVANGIVYAGSDDGKVYAWDANTGQLAWTYATGGDVYSSPTVFNGVVYVGSNDGSVYALNATTGSVMWSYPTGASIGSSPTVANGIVYVGSEDDYIYALNTTTETTAWAPYKTVNAVYCSPNVANGIVYVGSNDGYIYALNADAGGAPIWTFPTENPNVNKPAVSSGVVYIGSHGYVYALNAISGALKWEYKMGSGSSAPTVSNGTLYVASGGAMYAFAP